MELYLVVTDTIEGNGVGIPWSQGRNTHSYFIGGQHTLNTFQELAKRHLKGFVAHEELLEFEVIWTFSRDLELLLCVSKARNLNIAKKVVKENCKSSTELYKAKWIAVGSLKPH